MNENHCMGGWIFMAGVDLVTQGWGGLAAKQGPIGLNGK
jgi:hypothetical protein